MGLIAAGCGKSSTRTTPSADIYVDIANTGSEDGSETHPYNTVGEAIAAASAGQIILIANGTYDNETSPLYLKPGIRLQGESRDSTIIPVQIADSTVSLLPIELVSLAFSGFNFSRSASTGTPSEFNKIEYCKISGDIALQHGGNHKFIIKISVVNGSVRVEHGSGSSVNVINNNTVHGSILLEHGNCSSDTVASNIISFGDIVDVSGQCNTVIMSNTIQNGQIIDRSDAGTEMIRNNIISYTPSVEDEDSVGILSAGVSASIIGNILTVSGGATGIKASSGSPTVIDSNTIEVLGNGIGINVYSGQGAVIGNTIGGGFYGIYDRSGASIVSFNQIEYAGNGVYTSGAGKYSNNRISHCSGDGMILHGVRGPIEANIITNNGGVGIDITLGSPDLGGGADSCTGNNVIQNNKQCDLVNETALLIKAENNSWDHINPAEIDSIDIVDDDDIPGLGQVDFEPFH